MAKKNDIWKAIFTLSGDRKFTGDAIAKAESMITNGKNASDVFLYLMGTKNEGFGEKEAIKFIDSTKIAYKGSYEQRDFIRDNLPKSAWSKINSRADFKEQLVARAVSLQQKLVGKINRKNKTFEDEYMKITAGVVIESANVIEKLSISNLMMLIESLKKQRYNKTHYIPSLRSTYRFWKDIEFEIEEGYEYYEKNVLGKYGKLAPSFDEWSDFRSDETIITDFTKAYNKRNRRADLYRTLTPKEIAQMDGKLHYKKGVARKINSSKKSKKKFGGLRIKKTPIKPKVILNTSVNKGTKQKQGKFYMKRNPK